MQDLIQKIYEEQNPQDGSVPQWAVKLCLEFGKQVCDLQIEQCKEDAKPDYIWIDDVEKAENIACNCDDERFIISRDVIGNIDGYYTLSIELNTKNICDT